MAGHIFRSTVGPVPRIFLTVLMLTAFCCPLLAQVSTFLESPVLASKLNLPSRTRAFSDAQIAALPEGTQHLRLCNPSNSVVATAARFKKLETLEICGGDKPAFSGEALSKLSDLPSLRLVVLDNFQLQPEHMAALGKFRAMVMLSLRYSNITSTSPDGKFVGGLGLLSDCPALEALELDGAEFGSEAENLDDFAGIKKLRYLGLRSLRKERYPDQLRMALRCKSLEHLAIRLNQDNYPVNTEDLVALGNLTSLKRLDLRIDGDRGRIPSDALLAALKSLKSLEQLDLAITGGEGGDFLAGLVDTPTLTSLRFAGSRSATASLGKLKQLERLEFLPATRGRGLLGSKDLACLAQLMKLKSLTISGFRSDLPETLTGLKQLRRLEARLGEGLTLTQFGALTSLESLDVCIAAGSDDGACAKVIKSMKSLKSLSLLYSPRDGDAAGPLGSETAAAIDSLATLEELAIDGMASPKPFPIPSFSGLKLLKKLRLLQMPWLTPDQLRSVTKLGQLQHLELNGCEQTATRETMALAGQCKALRVLIIYAPPKQGTWEQPGLDDDSFAAIAGLANLERLEVVFSAITDSGLKHVGKLKNLRFLTLFHASKLTDAGLPNLKALSRLEEFRYGEGNFTSEALIKLFQDVPFVLVERTF